MINCQLFAIHFLLPTAYRLLACDFSKSQTIQSGPAGRWAAYCLLPPQGSLRYVW